LTAARILVVEDEAITAMSLSRSLEDLGFEVVAIASRAEEALALVASERPDLVLMDIRIRGPLDGTETARLIRDRFGTPVVFMTAYADEITIRKAAQASPFGYLVKPYQERDVRGAIEVALHLDALMKERDGAMAALADRATRLASAEALLERVRALKSASFRDTLDALATLLRSVEEHPDAALPPRTDRVLRETLRDLSELSSILDAMEDTDASSSLPPPSASSFQ